MAGGVVAQNEISFNFFHILSFSLPWFQIRWDQVATKLFMVKFSQDCHLNNKINKWEVLCHCHP